MLALHLGGDADGADSTVVFFAGAVWLASRRVLQVALRRCFFCKQIKSAKLFWAMSALIALLVVFVIRTSLVTAVDCS